MKIKHSMANFIQAERQIIINESDIDDEFQSIYPKVTYRSLGKDSGWIIDSVIQPTIVIWKYNPLTGSSYIKLPKEDHPKEGLTNIHDIDDNECFQWSAVRYLNPTDHNPIKITKADKD